MRALLWRGSAVGAPRRSPAQAETDVRLSGAQFHSGLAGRWGRFASRLYHQETGSGYKPGENQRPHQALGYRAPAELFPVTDKERQAAAPQTAAEQLSGTATVLVIDDEQIVRHTAKAMLERYGYAVLIAENGKEGVDLYRVVRDKIGLVILDMTMPVMSGEETLRNLKLLDTNVKVLLSSGHNEAEAIRRFAGKGLIGFIQKPYSATQLAQKVKAALE